METDLIKIFIDVAEAGSFAAAARRRELAVSSISRSIAALEEALNVRLFHRSTRKLTLTTEGKEYFDRILPVLEDLEYINSNLASNSSETLRITIPAAYGRVKLLSLISEFQKLHPGIDLEVVISDSTIDLVSNRIDLAIRLGDLEDSSHHARKLSEIRYITCASPEYLADNTKPLAPIDLAKHNCLFFPKPGDRDIWKFKHNENTQEIRVSGNFLVSDTEALVTLARQHLGITLVPEWAAKKYIEKGELTALFSEFEVTNRSFTASVWAVYASKQHLSARVQRFIEFLNKSL